MIIFHSENNMSLRIIHLTSGDRCRPGELGRPGRAEYGRPVVVEVYSFDGGVFVDI